MIFIAVEKYFKKLKTPVWNVLGIEQTTWIQYKTKNKLPNKHIEALSEALGEDELFKIGSEENVLNNLIRKYYE